MASSSSTPIKFERRLDVLSRGHVSGVVQFPQWPPVDEKQHPNSFHLHFHDNDSEVYPVDVAQIPLDTVVESPLELNHHIPPGSRLWAWRRLRGNNFVKHSHLLNSICVLVKIFSRFSSSVLHACPNLAMRPDNPGTYTEGFLRRNNVCISMFTIIYYQWDCKVQENLRALQMAGQTFLHRTFRLHGFETPVFGLKMVSRFSAWNTIDELGKGLCILPPAFGKMCIYIKHISNKARLPPNLWRTLSVLSPDISTIWWADTMSSYPYLAFREVEVEEEEYSLSCDKSLYVMCHQFFSNIYHLKLVWTSLVKPCSTEGFQRPPRTPQLVHRLFHSSQLVS